MMYASKIEIKREPQLVKYVRVIDLPDKLFTVKDISKHIKKGEKFYFTEQEDCSITMSVYGKRLETQKEVDERVAKQEKYMENYYKHHAKYSKK